MNNKAPGIQTVSIKRDNSKAQISRYLLDNKNKLPQKIVLSWQNFQEIEELLNNQIEADLKSINSRVSKKKYRFSITCHLNCASIHCFGFCCTFD